MNNLYIYTAYRYVRQWVHDNPRSRYITLENVPHNKEWKDSSHHRM
jgi:hypothetical protein